MNNNDYIKILQFYNQSIPKTKRQMKVKSEKILSSKLCRCIKRIQPLNESRSIGICTKTIFNRKGYTRGKFSCKKKQNVTFRKTTKRKSKKSNRK
jgi:hypothetical protein